MDDMPEQIHLHRIDPTLNMHRFYTLTIQQTLFGEVSVVRNWGRIGTHGQAMIQTFSHVDDALRVLQRIRSSKLRRGYCAVG